MALEVVEQGHDCCPPDMQFEAVECCELGDVSVDARFGTIEPLDAPDQDALPAHSMYQSSSITKWRRIASVDPPDPPDRHPPLYDLYCVYLK